MEKQKYWKENFWVEKSGDLIYEGILSNHVIPLELVF